MYLSGTGITSGYYRVTPGFKVDTRLAIIWVQGSDGNWVGTDRGSVEDVYRSKIKFYSREFDEINKLVQGLEDNRQAGSHEVEMSRFAADEKIFGADLDYTGAFDVSIVSLGKRTQKTWRGFEVELEVQCLSPSFSSSASLPTLQYVRHGYEAYRSMDISRLDTYEGVWNHVDNQVDDGIWSGKLLFSDEDMGKYRRYMATQRAATVSISAIAGVDYPFGPQGSSYPISVKLLELSDEERPSLAFWRCKVMFAEVR